MTVHRYGPGLTSGIAGEFGYFYIQLTDSYGNSILFTPPEVILMTLKQLDNSYPECTVMPKLTCGSREMMPEQTLSSGGIYIHFLFPSTLHDILCHVFFKSLFKNCIGFDNTHTYTSTI